MWGDGGILAAIRETGVSPWREPTAARLRDVRASGLSPVEGHPGAALGATREAGGLALAEVHYAPGFSMGRHGHEQAYFTLVLAGSYSEQMDARDRTCLPGSVVFRPAGEPHASRFGAAPSRCLRVRLGPQWLQSACVGLRLPERSSEMRRGRAVWLAAQIHEELHSRDDAAGLALEGLALALLAETVRAPPVGRGGSPAWLRLVLERLHSEFPSPLTLADLATTAGVHPVHLARVFHRCQRATVATYLRRLRVEAAQHELRATGRPLADIARAAGFADQSHFSRTFKKLTGWTPQAYRDSLAARRRQ